MLAAGKLPMAPFWARLQGGGAGATAARHAAVTMMKSSARGRVAARPLTGCQPRAAFGLGITLDGTLPRLHELRARRSAVLGQRHMSFENVFGDSDGSRTVVESYHESGFIVNQTLLQGAVILLPSSSYLWNVTDLEDITVDSLVILKMLKNTPEICVFGTGRRMQRLPLEVQKYMKELGINVEIADTVNGLATFNVLNEEGRNVAGCFIPLDPIEKQAEALLTAEKEAQEKAASEPPSTEAPTGAEGGGKSRPRE